MVELYLMFAAIFGVAFFICETAEPDSGPLWWAIALACGLLWPLIGLAWIIGRVGEWFTRTNEGRHG